MLFSGAELIGRPSLDSIAPTIQNAPMKIPGRVQDGVIVLPPGVTMPEGTPVVVSCNLPTQAKTGRKKRRVVLPLVPSSRPGTVDLTGERIAKILEEEDLCALPKPLRVRRS
jgi:hypothetical protein